jgi:hypothetical protein
MADNSIQLDSGGSYLFVGNSFTFGRVDPVMSYNSANVRDLTAPVPGTTFANTTGSNPYELHPWGGVPGLFEAFASQSGLELDVAISARNAATLQGQYLNSNPAGWDLRGNVASQAWDVVVLQDNSTQPLPSGSGSVTFAAGSSTATLTIDPTADTKVETDETIGLQITPSSAYRTSAGVVSGTILNDDPTGPTVNPALSTVTLVASPGAVLEDGTQKLVYTFARSGPTTSALTVQFAAARDGSTAPSVASGGDFENNANQFTMSFQANTGVQAAGSVSFTAPGSGSVTIPAGASSVTFTLDPRPDTTVENDESIRLTLSANANYNVGTPGPVSATILNDDFAPGTDLSVPNISLSLASSGVYEDGSGNLVYAFTRTGSNTAALTVNFSVSGTATLAGNDFTVTGANSFSSPGAADPDLQSFKTYAVKLAQYATTGAADGAVPANAHANAATEVYLYETWARPNMITGALVANTDDTTGAVTNTTTTAPEYYLSLEAMTADLKAAYQGLAAANPIFAGVAPVGEAFLAAVQDGTAMRNPYAPDAGKIDLWWDDNLHASKYGSYLSGLTLFGKLTGLDPRSLGAAEHVASDLGITQAVAAALQNVAAATLGFTLDAHWTAPGQVTELQGGVTGLLATEGSFGFSDSDVADTHTIAVAALTPGSVGTFSAAVHTDTTGDGTGGSVDWLFTVDNADVAFLSPGESRVEHFLVTISDANGGSAQRDVAITLNGTYNDAPGASMTTDPYAATEQIALNLKSTGMSVSDVDSGGGSETATLSVGEGTLHVDAGTSGAGVSGDNTSSVTITGTLAQINALLDTDGTSVVSYIDNTDTPSASTTLTLHVDDGATTGTDTSIINITAVNDAPFSTITPTNYSATEQVNLSLKNNGLAVSDIDGSAGSETVTLSVAEGVLNVTAGGSGAIVNNSGTGAVTITGTAAQINALLNTDGTSTVSYIDNSDTPAANTTLTLLIHDNGNTGTGGDHSSSDTATINITAVNDAPVFTNLGEGAHPNFVENGASVVLDNNVAVSDPELNAAGNYGGATLTLARNGGANPDDTFAATGSLDLVDSNGLGENVSLDGGATFIGTATQPGDGTFSVTFNASTTAANVASVMRQIVYADSSENPEASAQIDWSFSDGNAGAQGSGGVGVATGSVTVDIAQVDDAPILLNVSPGSAYTIGSPGVVLSPALGVFDVDATAPSPLQGLASATIKIDSGFFAGDELFVNLATSGGHFVTADGDTTNISVQSSVLGALILSGNDTVAHYQSVLDAVSYHSTAADPSNGGANPSRNISWQVNDGALNSQTPNPDPNNLVSETVLHFDVAPKVDLDASGAGTGFTTTFTENGAPLAIVDTDVSIVDSDDANLDTATIVLTNAKPTDALSIAGALPGGIDSSIDTSTPGQITLHLSNSASLADYQTALGQVRFVNSSDTPDTADRDITVFVTNGADSNVAHATIHVIAVDDAPVAANASASGSEDTPISGIVSATDLDNTPSQLSYSLVGANGGAAHGAVVFHADGSYTYDPVHDFNGSDSFSFKANDGQLDSNLATVSLAVSAVNDAPVAANGSASGNEDTTINGTLSATDVDNTSAQLSYRLVGTNGGAAHGSVVVHADGTFTYTPAPNFNGSDSFSFKANDGALDSNVATESLAINAVNDAPVNTIPGPLDAQNGLDAAIIGLAVSDVDAASLTTSLHVDHGTLAVAAVGGATVIGSGTGTVTLSGSVAQIDAALGAQNNVVYQSAFNFVGTDHLTMTSNDGGGTGSGGPQTDTDVVDINAGHSAGAFLAFFILGSSDFHLH